AFWSSNTSYYPIRKAAYDVQQMKDTLAKYPQFGVAVEQLRATEPSFPTQGAVFGTFVQTRLAIEAAMDDYSRSVAVPALLDRLDELELTVLHLITTHAKERRIAVLVEAPLAQCAV